VWAEVVEAAQLDPQGARRGFHLPPQHVLGVEGRPVSRLEHPRVRLTGAQRLQPRDQFGRQRQATGAAVGLHGVDLPVVQAALDAERPVREVPPPDGERLTDPQPRRREEHDERGVRFGQPLGDGVPFVFNV